MFTHMMVPFPAILVTLLSLLSLAQGAVVPYVPRSISQGAALTILPIGASITVGVSSSDGNGYRKRLQTLLQNGGNSVSFVGTIHSGSMSSNACQAVPGQTISQVSSYADSTNVWQFRPDIVLLNAGTNDCNAAYGNRQGAAGNYATLLQMLSSHFPNALIVASSLVHNRNPSVDSCVAELNSKLRDAVSAANSTGRFAWADMYNAVPMNDIDANDKTHPVDSGYQIMAQTWYDQILQAAPRMWPVQKAAIVAPVASSTSSHVPASTTSEARKANAVTTSTSTSQSVPSSTSTSTISTVATTSSTSVISSPLTVSSSSTKSSASAPASTSSARSSVSAVSSTSEVSSAQPSTTALANTLPQTSGSSSSFTHLSGWMMALSMVFCTLF